MSLIINLTPSEEAQLTAAATQNGLTPDVFAAQLVRAHLVTGSSSDELTRKLQARQAQDRVHLMPSRSAAEIFAQWETEATQLTDAERAAEDRLWEDVQADINSTRAALGMRQL